MINYLRLIVLLLFISFSNTSLSQWEEINSGTTSNLYSLFLVNNEAWITGDNILLHSTNRGETWAKTELAGIFNSIFFTDSLTGWVCTEAGEIYKTSDGGISWNLKPTPAAFPLKTINFIDHQTGFASGFFQTVLKSTDGGETWFQSIHDGYQHFLTSLVHPGNTIVIAGTAGTIFKSVDLGGTWDSTNVGMPNGLYSISFINENTGFIFGCCGSYFKTVDGGLTWEDRGYLTDGYIIYSSHFINEFTGWAAGEHGWLLKTTDSGENWMNYSIDNSKEIRSLKFADENIGIAVGLNGLILRTTNGGGSATGINPANQTSLNSFELHQNYPNPFNPTTKLSFVIKHSSFVSLKIFDILGNEIATLVNEEKPAGSYEVEFNAKNLTSGLYFYKLIVGNFSETKQMLLLK